jgi:hypothetical protein
MLDANVDGADRREVSRIVLHIDAEQEPDRAHIGWVLLALRSFRYASALLLLTAIVCLGPRVDAERPREHREPPLQGYPCREAVACA